MLCGFDRRCVIQAGDPILELTCGTVQRKLVRCAQHAGEPVPEIMADLPAEPSRLQIPDFTAVGRLSKNFDHKLAAAGDRED
jgi:hypothetical protein